MSSRNNSRVSGSFRDPSGFLYFHNDILYRQVNLVYRDDFDLLSSSGLYEKLVGDNLLIPHEPAEIAPAVPEIAYRVIKPRRVEFISYPYEWCFSQYKDAALATLAIQKRAIEHGMTLKDASAYNIQFVDGKPMLIDTLSFERYEEGRPWVAYRQFCQHFLAPLALMSIRDIRLGYMLRTHLDGIPLDLASLMLPRRTWFAFSLLTHIHLHAKSQRKYAASSAQSATRGVSRQAMLGLIDSLESSVKKFAWRPEGTTWADYYDNTNYETESFKNKEKLVGEFLDRIKPSSVWDLGANTGRFSRIATAKGIPTVSFDLDPAAVEINYLESSKEGESHILPLILDLTNPSPSIGWEHKERMSLMQRGPADAALALALVHHLAIGNNVPLGKVAEFFRNICSSLIIEFVPKDDSQVQRLLSSREDVFPHYTIDHFEREFSRCFKVIDRADISGSLRTLFLMQRL